MVTFQDVMAARVRIGPTAQRTALLRSASLSQMLGCDLYLKAENLQRTGSFKIRGAANKIALLSQGDKVRGVIAASAGNHAQGVALAARTAGVAATIVMPVDASFAKVEATRNYGAQVELHGLSFDEALRHAMATAKERGLTFVHAYDDEDIIAGQGTLGLEVMEDLPDADVVVVPVGGGGLLAGVALAVKESRRQTRVVGVQAASAPAWARSFAEGKLVHVPARSTVADGIAVGRPGRAASRLIWEHVDAMATAAEEKITQAMVVLLERSKLLVEGAGAVGLAALLEGKIACAGCKVVLVLSGGNVDPTLLARVVEHGLADAGRFVVLRIAILDRPGRLARLLATVAGAEANVLDILHRRKGLHLPVGQVEVELLLETRDAAHGAQIAAALEAAGYLEEAPAAPRGPGPAARRFVAREAAGP